MKLSVITLTYNKLEYTKKFIASLYKYTKDFELIIVDNGSTDGTIDYLKTLPNIKLILNPENKGFSAGNNQGIELAEGEFIGFLNNDILLYPDWFEECEKVFEQENAAFVSPLHINPHFDNTDEKHYIKFFKKNIKNKQQYRKSFDACEFSCVITKKNVLNDVGGFDENYFPAFYEDNDLKYRAILKGYDVFVVNTVCFFHFGSITSAAENYNLKNNGEYYFSKYLLAEYLSIAAQERDVYRRIAEDMFKPPMNFLYKPLVIMRKARNRIRKILEKK